MKALDGFLAEIFREGPLISTSAEPPPLDLPDQASGIDPEYETTAIAAPPEVENAEITAQQAKSLLAGLNRDTAIRLRWAMRDIRSKRTKLSPVSENDLAALIDLGFVEMREGIPRLTGLGILALD